MPVTALPAAIEHNEHMLHDVMPMQQPQADAPGLLCDKHCVPDSAQKDIQHAPVVALPSPNHLTLAQWPDGPHPLDVACQTPPKAGPPAEIQFCRYRL